MPRFEPVEGGCRAAITQGPLLDRLHAFRICPWLLWPLALGNLAAVWYGWTDYYAAQFRETHAILWPFVSDSPHAVLALAMVLVLSAFGLRYAWLETAAWILNIKVGLWTVFVMLYWYEEYLRFDSGLRWLLFWLHVGMVGQAFVVHRALRPSRVGTGAFLAVAALVALDVVLDYAPGLSNHPRLPYGPYVFDSVVAIFTIVLTLTTLALAWLLYGPRRDRATVGPVS